VSNILDRILADKRVAVAKRREQQAEAELREQALDLPAAPPFAQALRGAGMGLIAEVKRRSPSAGLIREPFDPPAIAQDYEAAGAHALSVLMDEPYFGGGEGDFRAVRAAVKLPMLYKEFVVDPWQIWHARCIGASGLLLIAAALSDDELRSLMACAEEAGLEVLFEVHDREELKRGLDLGAEILGINNRNLKTFETKVEHSLEMLPGIPESCLRISESGIRTHADIQLLQEAGVDAVLVGEHLLRKQDLQQAVRDLLG